MGSSPSAFPAPPAPPVQSDSVTFESTVAQLVSPDPKVRQRAVALLKAAAYPESASPLGRLVLDSNDDVQLEAIGAELNIFLAEKVTPRKRVGLIVEVRGRIDAESIFSAGPSALGPRRVPLDVVLSLASASTDNHPRVAVEALYAFGILAGEVNRSDRRALLEQTAPMLAPIVGSPNPIMRMAAIRVAARVFGRRPSDPALNETLGDAVIAALNDREDPIRDAAIWALGAMRYERSVQALTDLFRYYQRKTLGPACFDALARIGHAASLPEFVAQMNARDQTFRAVAIEGLARAGDRSRADAVQAVLKNERSDAAMLAGHFANVMLANGSIEPILDALSRSRLHDQAIQYVYDVAPSRSQAFTRPLQDPDAGLRAEVLDILGLADDPEAIPFIEPLTRDKDPRVAEAAVRALARLGSTAPKS